MFSVFVFNKPLREDIGVLFARHFGNGAPPLNYRPRIDTPARRSYAFSKYHAVQVLTKRFSDVVPVPDKAVLQETVSQRKLSDKSMSTLRRHLVLYKPSWWKSKAVTPLAMACACINPLLQVFLSEKIRQCLHGFFAPIDVPVALRKQLATMAQNAKRVSIMDLNRDLPANTHLLRVKQTNRMQQVNAGYVLYKAIQSLIGNTPATDCLMPLVHNFFMEAIRVTGYLNRLKAWMQSYSDYYLLQVHTAANATLGITDPGLFLFKWVPEKDSMSAGGTPLWPRPFEGEHTLTFKSTLGKFVLRDSCVPEDQGLLRTSILHSCLRLYWQPSHAVDCSSSSAVCTKVPLDWAARFHVFHMSIASNNCGVYEKILTYDNVPIQTDVESMLHEKVMSGSGMLALLKSKPGVLY